MIQRVRTLPHDGWLALRSRLWPRSSREEHLAEMARWVAWPDRCAVFIHAGPGDRALGLAEASLRTDYVNGTRSSPVAFLEGLYVVPEARRRGVARALVAAVERWARERGCVELASDARIGNRVGRAVHRALGLEETERVVFFRKGL